MKIKAGIKAPEKIFFFSVFEKRKKKTCVRRYPKLVVASKTYISEKKKKKNYISENQKTFSLCSSMPKPQLRSLDFITCDQNYCSLPQKYVRIFPRVSGGEAKTPKSQRSGLWTKLWWVGVSTRTLEVRSVLCHWYLAWGEASSEIAFLALPIQP